MKISGRWYSEHALERMAPDTPQVRAELSARVAKRLEKLGLKNTPAYVACLKKALSMIDPRGIPPSVVEAEIANPGSTGVKVIVARGGRVVVTVMPKGK
jgi:CTP:molybdopterin cytidylyltransferase MocA